MGSWVGLILKLGFVNKYLYQIPHTLPEPRNVCYGGVLLAGQICDVLLQVIWYVQQIVVLDHISTRLDCDIC